MFAGKYLLRFDDICPTMDWDVWGLIEEEVRKCRVRPLLAIVPDNCDPELKRSEPVGTFWERVAAWQRDGFAIGVHGYQHDFVNDNPGIVGTTRKSEFAGLSIEIQERKLAAAMGIFEHHGVRPDCWVAPAHSFDEITLQLLPKFGLTTISDGFHCLPHVDSDGFLWVPQQLWSFRWRPFGVWTICFHSNTWTKHDIHAFRVGLMTYAKRCFSLRDITEEYADRKKGWSDRGFAAAYRRAARAKRNLKELFRLNEAPAVPRS